LPSFLYRLADQLAGEERLAKTKLIRDKDAVTPFEDGEVHSAR
jgi:hypothetical protein